MLSIGQFRIELNGVVSAGFLVWWKWSQFNNDCVFSKTNEMYLMKHNAVFAISSNDVHSQFSDWCNTTHCNKMEIVLHFTEKEWKPFSNTAQNDNDKHKYWRLKQWPHTQPYDTRRAMFTNSFIVMQFHKCFTRSRLTYFFLCVCRMCFNFCCIFSHFIL